MGRGKVISFNYNNNNNYFNYNKKKIYIVLLLVQFYASSFFIFPFLSSSHNPPPQPFNSPIIYKPCRTIIVVACCLPHSIFLFLHFTGTGWTLQNTAAQRAFRPNPFDIGARTTSMTF